MRKHISFVRAFRVKQRDTASRRRGATAVVVVITVPVLLGMAALTIDVGHLQLVRQELQTAADAAALAAADLLPDETAAHAAAHQYATAQPNQPNRDVSTSEIINKDTRAASEIARPARRT